MKRLVFAFILTMSVTALAANKSTTLQPYTLAGIQQGDIKAVQLQVSELLVASGFTVVGSYSPMQTNTLSVTCFTHPSLLANAKKAGGLLGLSATLRIGLHRTEQGIEVAYTTPAYWGNAYFRKAYTAVESDYSAIDKRLRESLSKLDKTIFKPYGSKKGLSAKQLKKYHYMMAMPYFDDVVVLAKKTPYAEAVKRIEARTKDNPNASLVYAVKFPEQNMALFGIALNGKNGEQKFLPKIDMATPRHTPFLPYEILVQKDRTVMLHGKYRIALSFPDLTMGTFMKIMSTPDDIADDLRKLVETNK